MATTRRLLAASLLLALVAPPALPGAARAETATGPGPLTVSVKDAVLMSLEHNRALQVQRFQPSITRTAEDAAAAAFDLNLSGELAATWDRAPFSSGGGYRSSDEQDLLVGGSRFFATGTTVEAGVEFSHTDDPDEFSTRAGLSVTQALLQGRGSDVNLAVLRQARLGTAMSAYELRGYAESLVAQVEESCWDYLLSVRNIEIVERSLKLADDQLAEVRERVSVGRLAEIEAAAAEAEVATRREALINARSLLATTRLKLLQLLNPPGENALGREIAVTDAPALPPPDPDPVASHVALGLQRRNDLNQARLDLKHGELEVVKTRNGLLPKLDFFINLGGSGSTDAKTGLTLGLPWQNRAARAAERSAVLTRDQAEQAVENLAQIVEVEIRGAWIEADRLREQVAATAATLRLQQEKLRAETEKFRVGKSTTYLVAQAQRDLLQAEREAEASVGGYLKALVECYRVEGTLLDRRGLTVADR